MMGTRINLVYYLLNQYPMQEFRYGLDYKSALPKTDEKKNKLPASGDSARLSITKPDHECLLLHTLLIQMLNLYGQWRGNMD